MSITKRIDKARDAFAKHDLEAAAAVHTPEEIAKSSFIPPEEHGGAVSQHVGDFIYGGLDGVVTTFAVVSGVAGAHLGTEVVLILGLANLFADGFSMATGAYLSTRSENEYYDRERQRETWEVENFPEGERAELAQIYRNQGYSEEEADQLVEILSRDDKRMVDAMMIDELGLMKTDKHPLMSALATLVAFIVVGSVPLLIYLLGLFISVAEGIRFPVSIVLSAVALFALGAGKVLVTHQSPWKKGFEMLVVGGFAAVVAYVVGAVLKGLGI